MPSNRLIPTVTDRDGAGPAFPEGTWRVYDADQAYTARSATARSNATVPQVRDIVARRGFLIGPWGYYQFFYQ